jgi:uncharacterized DUF497 family protein
MPIEWDEAKRRLNLDKHGVDFADIDTFDWYGALIRADVRMNYGEVRLRAVGPAGDVLHVLVYTIRRTRLRLISFRRANRREIALYVAETQDSHG